MKKEDKEKEILELKKLYLIQIEKSEIRTYFLFLSLSISLLILYFRYNNITILYWSIGLYLTTLISDFLINYWRTNKFNELKKEIEKGKFKDIKFNPIKTK